MKELCVQKMVVLLVSKWVGLKLFLVFQRKIEQVRKHQRDQERMYQ